MIPQRAVTAPHRRLAALVFLVALAPVAPAHGRKPPPTITLAAVEAGDLNPWFAGVMRMEVVSFAATCVARAGKVPDGTIDVAIDVDEQGRATKVDIPAPARALRGTAACLRRSLAGKSYTVPPKPYRWRSTLRIGFGDWISPVVLRLEADHEPRLLIENAILLAIERAACVAQASDPHMAVALDADLALAPAAPATVKVTFSTLGPDALLPCLEGALATIPLPAGMPATRAHAFFHLVQVVSADEAEASGAPKIISATPASDEPVDMVGAADQPRARPRGGSRKPAKAK